jgi:putative autoinducer-2 (AI-2) aldolase
MPDVDEMKEGKKYYTDVPQQTEGFFLKGSNALDWGMKNRLARIFNPKTGRTVLQDSYPNLCRVRGPLY